MVDAGAADAAPRPEADALTSTLAKNAVLRPDDYAEAWRVRTEPATRLLDESSCSYRKGGPEAKLPTGAVQRGATVQLADEPAFITSVGWVFPDEASAVKWMEVVRSEEWAQCRADTFAAEGRSRGSLTDVTLETREIDHLGERGFEAYAEFHGRDEFDRAVVVISVMHYRLGRVVLEDTLERAMDLNDANWAAVDSAHSTALTTAWVRLSAGRPAGGQSATPVAAR